MVFHAETGLEPALPHEFIVVGTPVSQQAKRAKNKESWMQEVKSASSASLDPGFFCHFGRLAVTLYYFPQEPMTGDIDNIVKPVLDAMTAHIYQDDQQVERVVVQRFEPGNIFRFDSPSDKLLEAIDAPKPVLYVRVSGDPFEELR